MMQNPDHSWVIHEYRTSPDHAATVADQAMSVAHETSTEAHGCTGWAVHVADDRQRVVVFESWSDERAYRAVERRATIAGRAVTSDVYRRVGPATHSLLPTASPETDPAVVVIDCFQVWRPLAWPVSAFTRRKGRAFDRSPGCLGTSVLRSTSSGRIATHARWCRLEDFFTAFTTVQGT
ncbi:MAG: putative quinol monooxygenase, partial [Rhodoglobus sp.]